MLTARQTWGAHCDPCVLSLWCKAGLYGDLNAFHDRIMSVSRRVLCGLLESSQGWYVWLEC